MDNAELYAVKGFLLDYIYLIRNGFVVESII